MSYTKGPWKFKPAKGIFLPGIFAAGNILSYFKTDVCEDDGRLMASAPDLLEALEALITAVDHSAYGAALSNARKAIARAKGEQA